MTDQWRLFFAIELPEDVRQHLATIQDGIRRRVPGRALRWVDPAGVHLTLKFLGDVPATKVEALCNALSEATASQRVFPLATGELGCFPNPRRPRVVWVAVREPQAELLSLHKALETNLAPLGFGAGERRFQPHLTLGRVRPEISRAAVDALATALQQTSADPPATWQVAEAVLFRSELRPSGAVYTALCRALLTR